MRNVKILLISILAILILGCPLLEDAPKTCPAGSAGQVPEISISLSPASIAEGETATITLSSNIAVSEITAIVMNVSGNRDQLLRGTGSRGQSLGESISGVIERDNCTSSLNFTARSDRISPEDGHRVTFNLQPPNSGSGGRYTISSNNNVVTIGIRDLPPPPQVSLRNNRAGNTGAQTINEGEMASFRFTIDQPQSKEIPIVYRFTHSGSMHLYNPGSIVWDSTTPGGQERPAFTMPSSRGVQTQQYRITIPAGLSHVELPFTSRQDPDGRNEIVEIAHFSVPSGIVKENSSNRLSGNYRITVIDDELPQISLSVSSTNPMVGDRITLTLSSSTSLPNEITLMARSTPSPKPPSGMTARMQLDWPSDVMVASSRTAADLLAAVRLISIPLSEDSLGAMRDKVLSITVNNRDPQTGDSIRVEFSDTREYSISPKDFTLNLNM